MKNGSFLGTQHEKLNKYLIELKNDKYLENNKKDIIKLGFEMKDKKWQKLII